MKGRCHLKYALSFTAILYLTTSYGFPVKEEISRHEEVDLKGRAYEPLHLLKKEHRQSELQDPLENVMDRVLSSRTASAVDRMASGIVQLAGGVVEDLGDFVVETIDQLPETIRTVSDAVGKAVDNKREKVLIMVKGVGVSDDGAKLAQKTTKRLSSAVQNSQFQSSFQTLEDAFASFFGKFIGVTYKNADHISSAISDGFKRITGSDAEKSVENLDVLSRSSKGPYVIKEIIDVDDTDKTSANEIRENEDGSTVNS